MDPPIGTEVHAPDPAPPHWPAPNHRGWTRARAPLMQPGDANRSKYARIAAGRPQAPSSAHSNSATSALDALVSVCRNALPPSVRRDLLRRPRPGAVHPRHRPGRRRHRPLGEPGRCWPPARRGAGATRPRLHLIVEDPRSRRDATPARTRSASAPRSPRCTRPRFAAQAATERRWTSTPPLPTPSVFRPR